MSKQRNSHARKNLLTGEWILVSPNRMDRPWQGQVEVPDNASVPEFSSDCYLCPGNRRANDNSNPDYRGTFVFDNDFPALSSGGDIDEPAGEVFQARSETGRCKVVCYTEKHNQRLSTMDVEDITTAIRTLTEEFVILDRDQDIGYVQVFENRGRMMGCSNEHPHAQVWATQNIPEEPRKELRTQSAWFNERGSLLLADYRDEELANRDRVVIDTGCFAAIVPFWATWPFETLLLPRRTFAGPDEMNDAEVSGLAETLKDVLGACDRMFETSAPYSMGFHPRPSDGQDHPEWLFHVHIYPPLLRSHSVRKHLVGFEMLAMPQRDLTPEAAAAKLRENLPRH